MKTILTYNDNTGKYFPAIILTILFSLPSMIPFQEGITPICFTLLTLVPLIHTTFITKELDFFDPIVMVSLTYAFGGPLAVLFKGYYEDSYTFYYLSHAEKSIIWAYRGFSCLMLAYFLTKMYVKSEKADILESEIEREHTLVFAKSLGLLVITGLIITLIIHGGVPYTFVESRFTYEASTVRQLLSYMVEMRYGFFLIYFLLKQSSRDKMLDVIFYIILFIHIIFIIGAGSKALVLSLLVCIAISVSLTKKKLSAKHFFVGIFAAGVIYLTFQVVTNYRVIVRNTPIYHEFSGNVFSSVAHQADMFFEAILTIFEKHKDYDTTSSIMGRLAYITSLEHVFTLTGGKSPYLQPIENLLIPLYSFAPRSVFTDKPVYLNSGDVAIMSGLTYGGVSVTLIGSFYWAWGYISIYFGMFFIGIIFANLVIRSMYPALHGARNKVLLMSIIVALIDPGQTFQSITTDLIRMWVFLHSLCFLITHLNILTALGIRREYNAFKRINRGSL